MSSNIPPQPPSGPVGPPGLPAPLAELGPRVVAFLIDWVAPSFAWWVVYFLLLLILKDIGLILGLLAGVAVFAWEIWNMVQEGNTGQSLGKKQQNIRLVGLENGGRPIGAGNAIVRALINGLPCSLGWVFPFFDPQRQTLGDKVTKSVVTVA